LLQQALHPHWTWPELQTLTQVPLAQDWPQPHAGLQFCTWQVPSMQSSPEPHVPTLQTPPQPSADPQALLPVQFGVQHLLVLGLHTPPASSQTVHSKPQLSGDAQLVVEQVVVQQVPVSMSQTCPEGQLWQVPPQPSVPPQEPVAQLGVQQPMPPSSRLTHSPSPEHSPGQTPPQPSGVPQPPEHCGWQQVPFLQTPSPSQLQVPPQPSSPPQVSPFPHSGVQQPKPPSDRFAQVPPVSRQLSGQKPPQPSSSPHEFGGQLGWHMHCP
jgi:hypothetical protein